MLRNTSKLSGESVESVLKKKRKAIMGKRKVLSLERKIQGVMDDESGELMEPIEEVQLKGLGESEW